MVAVPWICPCLILFDRSIVMARKIMTSWENPNGTLSIMVYCFLAEELAVPCCLFIEAARIIYRTELFSLCLRKKRIRIRTGTPVQQEE